VRAGKGGASAAGGAEVGSPWSSTAGAGKCSAAPDHPLGQAAEVLDQDQPEHRRHGPELADPERGDRLERADEVGDPGLVELAVGVRDQRQGQGVDAGVAPDLADGELGQLGVVAAGQVLLDLAEDVLDDVEVVREPFGVDPAPLGAVDLAGDPAVGPDQDLAVLGESTQDEVVRLEARGHDAGGGEPLRQRLQAVEAVKFGADRRLAPRVEERRDRRVRGERGRVGSG